MVRVADGGTLNTRAAGAVAVPPVPDPAPGAGDVLTDPAPLATGAGVAEDPPPAAASRAPQPDRPAVTTAMITISASRSSRMWLRRADRGDGFPQAGWLPPGRDVAPRSRDCITERALGHAGAMHGALVAAHGRETWRDCQA